MYRKFGNSVRNLVKNQKGITGLETAIILIAFVTVAAVLAYTVLSAGIYSSEQGKAAVYNGLASAQSTMSLKGSVVGTADSATTPTKLQSVQFSLGLAITGTAVDLTQCAFNYWDSTLGITPLTLDTAASGTTTPTTTAGDWSYDIPGGTSSLSGTQSASITVVLPATATVASYNVFTIQINPPTGASITIQRMLGALAPIMSLN